jgi:hypothetical protein
MYLTFVSEGLLPNLTNYGTGYLLVFAYFN